ncbi:MAG: DUF1506 family protein [Candidatus Thermoplasmatota archaeon]|jgi:hypothetical protein|nr:DUF1506 family protein [Candidatus Thermoplasmatota archaeon]DAC54889.1 MAG TPA: DUF1506 domain-containing protein [Candidatus Poseidoniales archaeon]DAC59941.1 MAG TPA: DUF1506 domain-containing protein [Candidatus Poseidoniales archaeon]HII22899.1 DUF1506 family protein [Candidatus Poseidoniaceae archaeon]HII50322.1 DUF1506 family protein [Candidatus Poseidoniaceae archaeon]|tara:strand:- start:483 stop:755 length:273 start_codon:yes stop_codon:yes gene_type:complete
MEESWDDVSWEEKDVRLKEWYVEYIAVVNDQKYHHMSILYGEDMQDVQRSLLHEVRRNYNSTDRIDITVVKMKVTEVQTDAALFEGIYVP